ncbi:BRO-N domain-containing protein [Helicobacter rodentium]|uniref:BRO-N domain-containing protein n=3 Tax=Helicobacter rodentium TaxID=59617 RepID=UPI0023F45296|nr:BRO family protein [Helicobacter rodentium]
MQLQMFKNENLGQVRVLGNNENPLFCLSDVCKILEIQDTYKVKESILKEFELSTLEVDSFDTGFGVKQFTMITEPQLYFVLMRSDKPKAKPFRQWVVNEVLPSIRKQGYYLTSNVESTLIAELRDSNLSKDSLKRELESFKDELLVTQRELLNLYRFQPKSKVKEHSPVTIAKIQELAKSGVGTLEIARTLGVSKSSVRKYK